MEVYDIVVVGSGLAGIISAISAAEKGMKTVIIEKMPHHGGSSVLSIGAFAACNTLSQKRANIKDSQELFYNDIMQYGGNANKADLVRRLVKNSASAFKFICDRGADYSDRLFEVDGHSVPRCFQPPAGLGKSVIEPLIQHYLSLENTKLKLNTKVTDIIFSEGRAQGVVTTGGEYAAENGMIFAAGGFEREIWFKNPSLEKYKHIPTSTYAGATAETLKLLIRVGAQDYQTEYIRFGTSIAYNDIEKGVLIDINTSRRFISENTARDILAQKIIDIAGKDCWPLLILDNDIIKNNISNDEKIELMISSGEFQHFKNLEDLAAFFNLDIDAFIKTLDDYNKTEACSKNEYAKIETPPFYACVVYPKLNYTQGGVLIDKDARIIGKNGSPIKGLYAAGEFTGGIHGKQRLTACSTTECVVFGIQAAQSAMRKL